MRGDPDPSCKLIRQVLREGGEFRAGVITLRAAARPLAAAKPNRAATLATARPTGCAPRTANSYVHDREGVA